MHERARKNRTLKKWKDKKEKINYRIKCGDVSDDHIDILRTMTKKHDLIPSYLTHSLYFFEWLTYSKILVILSMDIWRKHSVYCHVLGSCLTN